MCHYLLRSPPSTSWVCLKICCLFADFPRPTRQRIFHNIRMLVACLVLHYISSWGKRIWSSHFQATSKIDQNSNIQALLVPLRRQRAKFFCCLSLLETMTVLFFAFHTDDPRQRCGRFFRDRSCREKRFSSGNYSNNHGKWLFTDYLFPSKKDDVP